MSLHAEGNFHGNLARNYRRIDRDYGFENQFDRLSHKLAFVLPDRQSHAPAFDEGNNASHTQHIINTTVTSQGAPL